MSDLRNTSIPNAPTLYFGRGHERQTLIDLLLHDDARLVTVHGPGGIGKTRFATQVLHDLATQHDTDVVFVDLTAATSADRMLAEIAAALQVPIDADSSLEAQITQSLGDRLPLMALDNIEQVEGAGEVISRLLRSTPGLTFLATSRTLLGIQGERRFALPPLLVAGDVDAHSVDALRRHPAIQLFADRARAARPDFTVIDASIATIRDICIRVDGLPLAIELAAARLQVYSPEQLLQKLQQSFSLLSAGPADAPERHRTMHQAIIFSTDLLTRTQQQFLADLALFDAGFTIEAAEAVATAPDGTAPDLLTDLVRQSLVQSRSESGGDLRFSLLQVVRDSCIQTLQTESSITAWRQRHAAYYARFSRMLADGLEGSDQARWGERGKAEYPNLLAALTWSIAAPDAASGTTIVGNIWPYWLQTGRMVEGRQLVEQVLALPGEVSPDILYTAENGLGVLNAVLGDAESAISAFGRAADLLRRAGNQSALASILNNLGTLSAQLGTYPDAARYFNEALDILAQENDDRRRPSILINLAAATHETGDLEQAIALCQQALALHRAHGNELGEATALHNLGEYLHDDSRTDEAVDCLVEAVRIFEDLEHVSMLISATNTLGDIAAGQGDLVTSDARFQQSLSRAREINSPRQIASALIGLARNAASRNTPRVALPLAREALTELDTGGDPIQIILAVEFMASLTHGFGSDDVTTTLTAWAERARRESGYAAVPSAIRLDDLRATVDPGAFDTAVARGESLSLPDIIALVLVYTPPARLGDPTPSPTSAPAELAQPAAHDLTARELEVLHLVAEGKSNADIGEALFISPFTAKTHVANLLAKLNVGTRAAAATWAARHGIL